MFNRKSKTFIVWVCQRQTHRLENKKLYVDLFYCLTRAEARAMKRQLRYTYKCRIVKRTTNDYIEEVK